jgi:N-acetylneuraminate lyase
MHADGRLNLDGIEAIAKRLAGERLSGVFIGGTTGEFPSLSAAERIELTERWCGRPRGSLRIIVHVGGDALEQSRTLASHAAEAGAHAIAAVAPYYFKPASLADLVEHCARIAAAAPGLPFYYYHIPCLSGVDFPMRGFLEQAAGRIPSLAGIKFSHLDLHDFIRCAHFDGGRFDMLFGVDEVLVSGLAAGARGAVGTTYNFAAPLSRRIVEAFEKGDVAAARQLQALSADAVAIFQRYGGHAAMKAVMALSGIDCGPARSPLRRLTSDDCRSLHAELEAIGYWKHCSPPPDGR